MRTSTLKRCVETGARSLKAESAGYRQVSIPTSIMGADVLFINEGNIAFTVNVDCQITEERRRRESYHDRPPSTNRCACRSGWRTQTSLPKRSISSAMLLFQRRSYTQQRVSTLLFSMSPVFVLGMDRGRIQKKRRNCSPPIS